MKTMSVIRLYTPSVLAAVGCVLLTVASSGCDNAAGNARDDAATAIEAQSRELKRLAYSTVYPLQDSQSDAEKFERIRQEYSQFIQTIEAISKDALPVQIANAKGMASHAHLVLADLTMSDVDALEEKITDHMDQIILNLGAALDYKAMADASATIDLTNAKARVDEEETLSRQRQNDYRKTIRDIQARIDSLEGEIRKELADYERLRNDAATTYEAALVADLDDRRALHEEAAATGRRADSHQVKAANLEARLDTVRPELATAQTLIDQTEIELIAFDVTRNAMTSREKYASDNVHARTIDKDSEVDKLKTVLETVHNDEVGRLKELFKSALNHTENAVATAEDARSVEGGKVRLVKAHQAVGRLQWRQAQFLRTYANFLNRMADEAALLGRGKIDAANYQTNDSDISDAERNAADSFRSALQAAETISDRDVDGEVKIRLINGLNDAILGLGGESAITDVSDSMADNSFEETDDANEFTEDRPTAVQGDVEGLRTFLHTLAGWVENSEYGKVYEVFELQDTENQKYFDLMASSAAITGRIERACLDQFNRSVEDIMGDDSQAGMFAAGGDTAMQEIQSLTADRVDGFEFGFDSSGSTGWISNNPSFDDMVFAYVGSEWKIEFNTNIDSNSPEVKLFDTIGSEIMDLLSDLADRTERGDFSTADDFKQAVLDLVNDMIMRAMSQGNSGGN